jgi:PAS domain S-box-containing protein
VRDADGNPLRLTGVNYDITQRKMAEEELIDSEKRFRTLFEQAAVGVAILETKTGHYVRINQKYCDFLGYTIEEMLNKRFQDVTFPEDIPTNVNNNTLLVAGKIQEFTIEKRYLRRDGKIVWGNLTASPLWLPGENPAVHYHIAVVQDITDHKWAEQEIINTQKIAATLAAGVAHELNSPLQVITGYSESLALQIKKDGKLEGERPLRQLDTINRNAWRVAEIVRSLKYYAHPDHEAVRETNLNNLVQDALTLIKPQIKNEAYIEIETELDEDIPPCKCEANKIMQVLINLLNNAYDAMPYGGKVIIQTKYEVGRQRLVLKMADTGKGIPEAIRARIFDPFFTTKPVGKGVGLGLSIVQSIVRAHGGEIEVESARGKGAIFTVYVPLEPPESAAGGAESQSANPPVARYD